MPKVAILDYDMGNLRSVRNAFEYCGADAVVTSTESEISDASHIVIPGVGAFGRAMENMAERGLDDLLDSKIRPSGRPILGICLGMQIMAESSDEHATDGQHGGLGWFSGQVVRIPSKHADVKVPHMGWNGISIVGKHPLFDTIRNDQQDFYFVHSYYLDCQEPDALLATAHHGMDLTAAVAKENIVATQFHPEKSQDNGIEFLTRFLGWTP